jgi:hypothetical protein
MNWMKHKKIVFAVTLVLLTSLLLGCSGAAKKQEVGKHEIVREAVLGSKWQLYQLRITLDAGSEFDVLLTLAEGDKVDGYFYPDKGSGAVFQIKANNTVVYGSQPAGATSTGSASDRYSFTASQTQGNTYILNLRNAISDSKVTVFLEVIYPTTGSIYIPLEAQ